MLTNNLHSKLNDRYYGYDQDSNTRILEIDGVRYTCNLSFSLGQIKVEATLNDKGEQVPHSPYEEVSSLYLNVSWNSEPAQSSGSFSVRVVDASIVSYTYDETMNKYLITNVTSPEAVEAFDDFESYVENTIVPLIEKDIKSTVLKDNRRILDNDLLSEGERLLSRKPASTSFSTNIGDNR